MKLWRIFLVRLKANLRSFSWVFVLAAMAISLLPYFTRGMPEGTLALVLVNEDKGGFGGRVAASFQGTDGVSFRELSRPEAMRALMAGQADVAAILRPNYSEKLRQGEFRNTVELYISPASRATSAASEPILNKTMLFWIEEDTVLRTRAYLAAQGVTLTGEKEAAMRREMEEVRLRGATTSIVAHMPPAAPASANDDTLAACARWYGALCAFYILVSAGWVRDSGGRFLRMRARQMGTSQPALLLGAGLAPLALSALFGAVALLTGCALGGYPLLRALPIFLSLLIYLFALLGLTMFLAAFTTTTAALLLLAPVVTFLNAALSGLLFTLPDWAATLEAVSRALPGRAFNAGVAAGRPTLGLLLCCAAWMALGVGAAGITNEYRKNYV